MEIRVRKLYYINRVDPRLPISVEDVGWSVEEFAKAEAVCQPPVQSAFACLLFECMKEEDTVLLLLQFSDDDDIWVQLMGSCCFAEGSATSLRWSGHA